jgi:hypothetical protein
MCVDGISGSKGMVGLIYCRQRTVREYLCIVLKQMEEEIILHGITIKDLSQ